ncbi:5-formyltetrahydrofolate cyclo-ligase [Bacteroidia bacterium]|nr:5-formyltetrahydrofolate cyclo-ligase [Bacteroidia bacterium]
MRQSVQQLPQAEKQRQSAQIFEQIERCDVFQKAASVLLFWALSDEVITQPFLEKWKTDKHLFLPIIAGNSLQMGRYTGVASLGNINAFGIAEPTPLQPAPTLDLVIVPGMAFDHHGNRLGRGKAYYDRFLPTIAAYKIGVCYHCQYLPALPCNEWDIRMDKIIVGKCGND